MVDGRTFFISANQETAKFSIEDFARFLVDLLHYERELPDGIAYVEVEKNDTGLSIYTKVPTKTDTTFSIREALRTLNNVLIDPTILSSCSAVDKKTVHNARDVLLCLGYEKEDKR